MPKNPVISNNKIIMLIAFVCCALMTSLFVYHMSHKQELTVFSDGNATLFPFARDIKNFKLASTKAADFSQKNLAEHWTLAFFGFTHCATICPATLDMLNHAYALLHPTYPDLQVVLISLDPNRDSIDKLAAYMASFNPDFIGAAGKLQDIRKLQSQFGIFSAEDTASDKANYQLQHTPSILLIDPHGKWAGIIKPNLSPAQFAETFKAMTASHHV